MKKRFLQIAGTGLLSLTLSGGWMAQPVSAQVADPAMEVNDDNDDDFDWGWLGLLGLLGLGGLMRRDRHPTEYRDTTHPVGTGPVTTTPRV